MSRTSGVKLGEQQRKVPEASRGDRVQGQWHLRTAQPQPGRPAAGPHKCVGYKVSSDSTPSPRAGCAARGHETAPRKPATRRSPPRGRVTGPPLRQKTKSEKHCFLLYLWADR